VVPLVVASAWSRTWIGDYFLVPLVLTLLWTFFDPRLFDGPTSLENWASKGVLDDRNWQQRDVYDIPRVFAVRTHVSSLVQVGGVVPFGDTARCLASSTGSGGPLDLFPAPTALDLLAWLRSQAPPRTVTAAR
jgi:hypothetical protein